MSTGYWEKLSSRYVLSRRKALALAGTGAGAAAVLAACGGSSSGKSSSSAKSSGSATSLPPNAKEAKFSPSSGTFAPGGTYKLVANVADNFNPVTQWGEGVNLGGLFAYDRPLTSREDTRRYVLEGMQSIELVDPTTVVMKLRPGSVFQNVAPVNGRAVKADDYVQSQAYELAEPKAFDKTFVQSFLDKATATDDQTITMKLKRPNAYLFGGQMLGSGTGQVLMPKETIGPQLDSAVQIGSGPYVADPGNRAQVHYLYKKSQTYWGNSQGYDPIANVDQTYILDKTAQETAFYGGQLDLFVPNPEQMKTAKSRMPNAFFNEDPGFGSTNISFNMWPDKDYPWKDIRVREAIWHLTDRNQIAQKGYQGAAVATVGLVPMSLKPYIPDAKDVSQYTTVDVAKAKQLLSAAGWDESKTWRIHTRTQGDVIENVALVQQTNMAQAGIKTRLETYGSAFFDLLSKKDWDFIVETPPGNDTPGQQIRTQHSDSWSAIYTGFALFDKTLDAMIEKSEETTDYEQNRQQVINIQKYAMSHFSGSMEVCTYFNLYILGPRVQNYELTQVGNAMRHSMWLKG